MDRPSKPVSIDARLLRVEELEDRIAPVIVNADPSTWVQGYIGGDDEQPIFDAWLEEGQDVGDHLYWIFYVGPGEANIGPGNTESDLIGNFITTVTITNSTMDSGLFIMGHPDGGDPSTELTAFFTEQGTIMVTGDIDVAGDMGVIAIDGVFGFFGHPTLTVNGDLGKFDVGAIMGDVYVAGDIWEIDVDGEIGALEDPQNRSSYWITDVSIAAEGNIGAIRVGVGLANPESVDGTDIIGGFIYGGTSIRANVDNAGPRGIIDLIEIREGSIWTGSSGIVEGDISPSYSAGPGGNIRFFRLDGIAWTETPTGNMEIAEIMIGTETPGFLRTVVDDSGGTVVINPQHEMYTLADGSSWEFWGAAGYLAIPVDRGESGPAVVIARLTVGFNVDLNVTGNVEFGEVTFFTTWTNLSTGQSLPIENIRSEISSLDFGEGTIDDLVITGPSDLANLQSAWHTRFMGTGEADIYYVHGEDMSVFQNLTRDGDIVSVDIDGDIIYISASRVGGDIGATESITPFLLKGPLYNDDGDVLWVDDDGSENVSPLAIEGSLTRYNGLYGVRAGGNIYGVSAGGAIGDVRSTSGNISLVVADMNGVEDAGTPLVEGHVIYVEAASSASAAGMDTGLVATFDGDGILYGHTGAISPYGKMFNTLGDGIFGHLMTGSGVPFPDAWGEPGFDGGGDIGLVRVGAGNEPTRLYMDNEYPTDVQPLGTGDFVTAGIYSSGAVLDVRATGAGRGIFGDVCGRGGIGNVTATDNAVIDGQNSVFGRLYIASLSSSVRTGSSEGDGTLDNVRATGPGSYIANVTFFSSEIGTIMATGGADGIFDISVTAVGASIGTISGSGAGIIGADIAAGLTIGRLASEGEGSRLEDVNAQALGGMRVLSTKLLIDSNIYALSVGQLATLDRMEDSTLSAGNLKTITVRGDVVGSTIEVGGPLDKLTIGGSLNSSSVLSRGPFAAIKSLIVSGDIIGSEVLSERNIVLVQSKTGSIINTDIIARGSTDLDPDLVMTRTASIGSVMAAGGISGTIEAGSADALNTDPTGENRIIGSIKTVKAGGDISADIKIGVMEFGENVIGDVVLGGTLGSLTAEGAFTGMLEVGVVTTTGAGATDILGDVTINSKVGKIKTEGNEASNMDIGLVDSDNNVAGNVSITASIAGIDSKADITGTIRIASIAAGGAVGGDVLMTSTIGPLKAEGTISADIEAGTINAGGAFTGQASFVSKVTSIKAAGNISGDLVIGQVTSAGGGGGEDGRGSIGTIQSGGSITGDYIIRGGVKSIKAAGDIGRPGGIIEVSQDLGTLSAGGRNQTGDILSEVIVGRDLRTLSSSGAFADSLTVGRNAGKIAVGGQLGNAGEVVAIGGNLTGLTVGSTIAFASVDSDISVGGKAGTMTVHGNINGNIDVTGNATKMDFGLVWGDIHVGGDLRSIDTGSGRQAGVPPVDFVFDNGDPFNFGSLTVDGTLFVIDGDRVS